MTDTAAPGFAALSTAPDTAAVCPYLLASDAAWRSASASRDHRCHAVVPAALLATSKQRRLCLVVEHADCSTYLAATSSALDDPPAARVEPDHRPVTRTAPLVLDRARMAITMPGLPARGGQGALVGLMVVAFGALAVTRLGGGPSIAPAAADPSGTPRPTLAASATAPRATAVPSPEVPTRTLVPSGVEPTATPVASPDPAPTPTPLQTPTPTPSPAPASYTVQSGDTLSGIAGRHGTTWQVLAKLNGIDDPRRLRVGQVIKLPRAG